MTKKLLFFLIGLLLAGVVSVLAAPASTIMRNILPETDNTYELGTTTLRWLRSYTQNASTTNLTISGISGCSSTQALITSADGVVSCGSITSTLSGGSPDTLAFWTSTTALSATSSPTIGYFVATTSTPSILTGGFISQASSTFSNGAFRVEGAATLAGGATITCTNCITDTNVVAALTISGGTIDNSTIGATTANTGRFTTLYAESTLGVVGATSLYSTLTSTSTIDFVDALTFRIPASASSTQTASGELEIDTNDRAIHFTSGSRTYNLVATTSITLKIASSTTGSESTPFVMPFDFVVDRVFSVNWISTRLGTTSLATTTGHEFQVWHGTRASPIALFTTSKNTTSTSSFFTHTGTFNDATIGIYEEVWVTDLNASSSLHDMVIQLDGWKQP